MDNDSTNDAAINSALKPYGLLLIGSLRVTDEDRVPDVAEGLPSRTVFLIGNGGSSFWSKFTCSPEFEDGMADPLDRWSRRVGNWAVKHAEPVRWARRLSISRSKQSFTWMLL
jgi:hypothetical protein